MKFTFGMHLDGWRSLKAPPKLNTMTGGLRVLLDQLELRLGLKSPQTNKARRVTQFRHALEKAQTAAPRFYSESFSKDPLGAAGVLLGWRDELVMAGWRGQDCGEGLPRLHDLTAVETCADEKIQTGEGDRIWRIMDVLDGGGTIPIEVDVIDDKSQLPHLLVQLCDRLDANYKKRPQFPLATEGSNLRQAQEALLGKRSDFHWNGVEDDSLTLYTSFSEITLAEVGARWATETVEEMTADRLLLTTSDPVPFVAALRGMNAPHPGSSQVSVERPILQMLRLALRLRWQPLNPQHLLEFLVHPVCPLPAFLRHRLAEAVAEQPGIGGPAWKDAVAKAVKAAEQWKQAGDNPEQELEAKLNQWVLIERADPTKGSPTSALIETCERVRKWALGRAANDPDQGDQWSLLAEHALDLGELLMEGNYVGWTELEQLLTLVQGQGMERGQGQVELGSIHCLGDPAAIVESFSEVFWWCAESPCRVSSPWFRAEREALQNLGVCLLSTETLLHAQHEAAMLPLLAARTRVRLFLPKQRAGEPVEHHPLFDELQALAGSPVPTMDVDEKIARGEGIPGLLRRTRVPLPAIRRWWKLPAPELLHPREVESFSSLEKFVFQPFAWVLQHRARLEDGAVGTFSIAADARQLGSLMHRVTEKLFASKSGFDWQSSSETQFNQWLDALWPTLLETEAANLRLPGMQADAERLKQDTQRALLHLIEQLRAAKVTEALADVTPARAQFRNEASIGGRIDLLVKREALPSTAVIDLKFGGKKKRQKELAENVPLQLAVYGYLAASESGGGWPDTAYFILKNGELLAQDTSFFPDASTVKVKGASTGPQACWNEFLSVWDWRRKQMDEGWIELPVEGTEPTDGSGDQPSSTPPDPRWETDPEADRYDDFKALTGWEEQA